MTTKAERVEQVNEMIKAIGDCGRRFFYSKSHERYANVELDHRGRIWWIDDYTGKRIYTHYDGRWGGFSHGGTLKALVGAFRDYIAKGTPLWSGYFGPWPEHYCGGDLWGYGEDMKRVREAAVSIGLVAH